MNKPSSVHLAGQTIGMATPEYISPFTIGSTTLYHIVMPIVNLTASKRTIKKQFQKADPDHQILLPETK